MQSYWNSISLIQQIHSFNILRNRVSHCTDKKTFSVLPELSFFLWNYFQACFDRYLINSLETFIHQLSQLPFVYHFQDRLLWKRSIMRLTFTVDCWVYFLKNKHHKNKCKIFPEVLPLEKKIAEGHEKDANIFFQNKFIFWSHVAAVFIFFCL